MLISHWVVFLCAPIVLFRAGWPITGGIVMLTSTLMPIIGQILFTDSDAPGLLFLLMMEVPIAGFALVVAFAMKLSRYLQKPSP
jgi:hypothetical protein